MATEKRLIDANALESQFRTTKIIEVFPEWENLSFQTKHKLAYYGQAVKRIVQNAPTVDAVEVVRCCDCVHCIPWQQYADAEVILYCKKKRPAVVDPTDFCSYGERKDNG